MTCVLFVTSNGTGLGHLTRCMAMARRLPEGVRPVIFTLSKALRQVRQQGFYAEYLPSRKASGLSGGQWNARFAARLTALIRDYEPSVVAFDGTYPYRGMRLVIETHRRPAWVWIRRPMWQAGTDSEQLAFSDLFDSVIEPGEFASEVDEGPTIGLRARAICVDPIVFCDQEELLSREEAEAELGFEPNRLRALIQLGEVPGEQRDLLMRSLANQILADPRAEVAILESAISEGLDLPAEVRKLSETYPIARFYRAFDFVVSAAGYNSYHELIKFKVPAGFFPVLKPLDNQAARARYAEHAGVGVEVGLDPTRAVEILTSSSERDRISRRAAERSFGNGASAAAEAIARLAESRSIVPGPTGQAGPERPSAIGPHHAVSRGAAASAGDSRISIAAATVEQLRSIKGVGPATARKIIALRDRRGSAVAVEELDQVSGIGPATMNALRGRLRP